jgi:hypothetical protein
MGMSVASRTRWLLALALGVLALVAAAQSAGSYVAHGVTVGLLAVIALAATVIAGLVSLGQARRRIGQELQALRATPAGGALLAERRQRLRAIQAAGVRPDRSALAEVAAADEAGRAYLGRYLVATTILIGLVGTFAGLMQTLGNVAPLLGQKDGDLLSLLAAPLGGLQITFAASLVAILATLALALAQGDLALHESQALALLEDRTTHELVPQLWPAAEDPAERTVRAVQELGNVLATNLKVDFSRALSEALGQSLEASARRMADSAHAESERAAQALKTTVTAVEQQIGRLAATVERQTRDLSEALGKSAERTLAEVAAQAERALAGVSTQAERTNTAVAGAASAITDRLEALSADLEAAARAELATLAEAAKAQSQALADSSQAHARVLESTSTAQVQALADSSQVHTQALASSSRERAEALAETVQAQLQAIVDRARTQAEAIADGARAQAEAITGSARSHAETLADTSRAQQQALQAAAEQVLAAFDRTVIGGGAALDAAATALSGAAGNFKSAADGLSPRLDGLAHELGAMSREVALLAARGPTGGGGDELGAVVLGELERLGTAVDRLAELVRLASAEPERAAVEPEPEPAPDNGAEANPEDAPS